MQEVPPVLLDSYAPQCLIIHAADHTHLHNVVPHCVWGAAGDH